MNEFNRINAETTAYDVNVGFARVRVEAESPDAAIDVARQALCREMPRMWDVIWKLAAQRFVVLPAAKAA